MTPNPSVPPYGEPVQEDQLRPDDYYFMLTYLDEARLIPELKTLAFLGKNVDGKSQHSLFFQDAQSYVRGGAYPANKRDVEIFRCEASGLSNIYRLEKAIESLVRCAD